MKFEKWNSLLKLILTACLILSLGLTAGCSDDDDITNPDDGNLGTGGTITATVDGTAMDYSENSSCTNPTDPDSRYINGGNQSSSALIIFVPENTGTYTIPNGGEASMSVVHNGTTWACVSGSVAVTTSTDTEIKGSFIGTFEDMGLNIITITNGSFDVPVVLIQ